MKDKHLITQIEALISKFEKGAIDNNKPSHYFSDPDWYYTPEEKKLFKLLEKQLEQNPNMKLPDDLKKTYPKDYEIHYD